MGGKINDGTNLENLIKEIEDLLIPKGFKIELRKKVFDDQKIQIAEFDIIISGYLGTCLITWLIECRDRPSEGSAPVSWIEQLYGRRDRFNIAKVTAVSTTGFSPEAVRYALSRGIELHQVEQLTSTDIIEWLNIIELIVEVNGMVLENVKPGLIEGTTQEELKAVDVKLKRVNKNCKIPILFYPRINRFISFSEAWAIVSENAPLHFEDIKPKDQKKPFRLPVNFRNPEDRFQIKTKFGLISIVQIIFSGYLFITEEKIPISRVITISEPYSRKIVSQTQQFSVKSLNKSIDFNFHKLPERNSLLLNIKITPEKKDNWFINKVEVN